MPLPDRREGTLDDAAVRRAILAKLTYAVGQNPARASDHDWFIAAALATRDLVVNRWVQSNRAQRRVPQIAADSIDSGDALGGLKALADPTRMRIVQMLREREQYAQEIVGKLGISQSAVSRHLGTLESAGIVTVRPVQGMKYYALDREFLRSLGGYIDNIAAVVAST